MMQFNIYDKSLSFENFDDDNSLINENDLIINNHQFWDSSLFISFNVNSMKLFIFDIIFIITILSFSSRIFEAAEIENMNCNQLFLLITNLSFEDSKSQ